MVNHLHAEERRRRRRRRRKAEKDVSIPFQECTIEVCVSLSLSVARSFALFHSLSSLFFFFFDDDDDDDV